MRIIKLSQELITDEEKKQKVLDFYDKAIGHGYNAECQILNQMEKCKLTDDWEISILYENLKNKIDNYKYEGKKPPLGQTEQGMEFRSFEIIPLTTEEDLDAAHDAIYAAAAEFVSQAYHQTNHLFALTKTTANNGVNSWYVDITNWPDSETFGPWFKEIMKKHRILVHN